MTAYRILDQSPVFFDLAGNLAAGGRIEFYDADTTAAKSVYGDQGLTVNNGSIIAIGSDGRAEDDIWGDGAYRVRVYAADGTLISDDDNVEIPGGTGTAIPALQAGKVLSNDGAVLQWLALLQPPDPTGQGGKVLGSNGSQLVWQDPPASPQLPTLPDGGITASSAKLVLGDVMIQWGAGTCPATGQRQSAVAVGFPTAFSAAPYFVSCSGTSQSVNSAGTLAVFAAISQSAAGFTAQADSNDYGENATRFTSPAPFQWLAIGPK